MGIADIRRQDMIDLDELVSSCRRLIATMGMLLLGRWLAIVWTVPKVHLNNLLLAISGDVENLRYAVMCALSACIKSNLLLTNTNVPSVLITMCKWLLLSGLQDIN